MYIPAPKIIIDTVVYRGGDMASAWIYTGPGAGVSLGLSAMALVAVPNNTVWTIVAYNLGRNHEERVVKQALQDKFETPQTRALPSVSEKLN